MSSSEGTVTEAPPEEEAAEERDEAREALLARFTESLGDAVVGSHIRPGDDLWVRVTREAWVETGRVARERLGMRYFEFLSAIDWLPSPFGRSMDAEVDTLATEAAPDAAPADSTDETDSADEAGEPGPGGLETGYAGGDTRFQVFARVANLRERTAVILKVDVPDDDLRLDTWVGLYHGANWHERECWEMFGISFEGHPYLRHLYLPGAFEGHPLRKDFPLLARMVKPWPGIVDVEGLPGGDDDEEGGEG